MKLSFFQAGVIAAFVLLAGVGLFVFSTYTGSAGKSSVGAVTIWGPFPKDAMIQAITTLANTDKNLKSVTYVQVQPDTFDSDYVNAVAAGKAPDLILVSQEHLQQLKPTLYEIPYSSISARQYADTFADGASVFEDANGTYGVPFAIDPLVMYFNKTLLSSSGIAAPPATWEAITGLVPSVTQTGANQGIAQALIALGTYPNVHNARGILSTLLFQAGVAITTPSASGAVQGTIASGAPTNGISPGDAAVRFYTSFANPAQTSYTWNSSLPDSQQYFVAGKLALYLGYASELSYLQQANPNLAFDVAKVPQPATASTRTDYGLFYAFAIPRTAPNQAGAFAVAVGLSSAADQTALVHAAGTLAPAEKALLSAPPSDQYSPVFYDQAIIAKGWLSPAPATTDTIFASMIQNVITGRSTLDQALTAAQQSLTAALQNP